MSRLMELLFLMRNIFRVRYDLGRHRDNCLHHHQGLRDQVDHQRLRGAGSTFSWRPVSSSMATVAVGGPWWTRREGGEGAQSQWEQQREGRLHTRHRRFPPVSRGLRGGPEWTIIDSICTFVSSILILATTISILKNTLEVLMEAAPSWVSYNLIKSSVSPSTVRLLPLQQVQRKSLTCLWSQPADTDKEKPVRRGRAAGPGTPTLGWRRPPPCLVCQFKKNGRQHSLLVNITLPLFFHFKLLFPGEGEKGCGFKWFLQSAETRRRRHVTHEHHRRISGMQICVENF